MSEPTVSLDVDSTREAGCRDQQGLSPQTSAVAAAGACADRTQGTPGTDLVRFEEVFSYEHLLNAALTCCKGVRWKSSTQVYEASLPMRVAVLHNQLISGAWKSKGFNEFRINERGKARRIQAVHITERTVQKCLIQYGLRPLIMPKLIAHSFATLPGKGTEAALKQHKEHLRWWYARHRREGYIVTMDYHDYFASVQHDKLKALYARLPIDERLYQLTCYLIDCFDGDRGLGLGSEISQISSLLYLNSVDHLAKDKLGLHCYGRYMDDAYLIADKQQAQEALAAITAESQRLGLTFNSKATQLRPLTQGWHYLKKRVMLTETGRIVMRLERGNIKRARQRLRKNAELVAAGIMTPESAAQSWQSWQAYASRYDARNTMRVVACSQLCSHLFPNSEQFPAKHSNTRHYTATVTSAKKNPA